MCVAETNITCKYFRKIIIIQYVFSIISGDDHRCYNVGGVRLWPSLLPLPGSEIFVSPIVSDGSWWSLTAFLFAVGAVIGTLFAGPALKLFDKRLGMAFFDAVLNISLFAITFPIGSTAFIVAGRLIILGIGSGALSAIVPYIGEISQPKFQGISYIIHIRFYFTNLKNIY